MDALSDILDTLKLNSVVYFRKNFISPWGMDIEQGEFAQFHLIVKGNCYLNLPGFGNPKQLNQGDIVVILNGEKHWIADKPDSRRLPGINIVSEHNKNKFKNQNIEGDSTLICGHFGFNRKIDHVFLKSLPSIIHISNTDLRDLNWLETLIKVIEQETDSGKPGSKIVVNRLGEILFIHLIRSYIEQYKISHGFLAALNNYHINRALSLIHTHPSNNWTLVNIAKNIGMSRAAFAAKFKQILGTTPIKYLTEWRMIKAMEFLRNTELSIYEIAERVGYYSESSFIRAFRKQFSLNPAQYRRSLK